MFDWITSDPDTMWLNITNVVLGLSVIACVAVGITGFARDVIAQARERARTRQTFVYDPHSMMIPELGLTMADGGEPVSEKDQKPKKG